MHRIIVGTVAGQHSAPHQSTILTELEVADGDIEGVSIPVPVELEVPQGILQRTLQESARDSGPKDVPVLIEHAADGWLIAGAGKGDTASLCSGHHCTLSGIMV